VAVSIIGLIYSNHSWFSRVSIEHDNKNNSLNGNLSNFSTWTCQTKLVNWTCHGELQTFQTELVKTELFKLTFSNWPSQLNLSNWIRHPEPVKTLTLTTFVKLNLSWWIVNLSNWTCQNWPSQTDLLKLTLSNWPSQLNLSNWIRHPEPVKTFTLTKFVKLNFSIWT